MTAIGWVTAFVDVPASRMATAADFWCAATGTRLSARRGEAGQFATFLPRRGDPQLRIQGLREGPPGVHVDLHSPDVDGLAGRAESLGASVQHREPGLVVLRSPAGIGLCCVASHGESELPPPVAGERVDQVCLDVPGDHHDQELAFWSGLTAWEVQHGTRHEEFTLLRRAGDPRSVQLLVQRLQGDDESGRAHLDLAVGADAELLDRTTARHTSLGAEVVQRHAWWHVMRDPAGLTYCLTRRDPVTGLA
ncbi:VOC family protein [Arsenicicoccus sp. oral taxon 190]|uniref:VOC family protein n=1 Tax=Arsenicicoccus sp. oral taxon 190 TaxID=1658671 RepID=UPI00067A35DF|nr:VOC family protein [Arsenicicoccus sp. oral taxon 190]AKT51973.1 hypothetical protein ADJ73_13035 [Arsenicicoccus sp. oral taxon 190]